MVLVKNNTENIDIGELISYGYGYLRRNETISRYLNLYVKPPSNFDESQLLDATTLSISIGGQTYVFDNITILKTTRTQEHLHIQIEQEL